MRKTTLCTLAVLALASCGNKPKRAARSGTDDPWAAPGATTTNGGGPSVPSLGGGDPMEMLKNIAENLKQPGPYEAPVKSDGFDPAKPHVGVMTLDGAIGELDSFSWTGMDNVRPLRKLTRRLRDLTADDQLTTLLLRVDDVSASLPDLAELRLALAAMRAKGKHVVCHTEGAANASYLLLAGCERLALAPTGEIMLTGPAAMPIHLKGLLDKLGVTADFLHVGDYKGAAEPLTRDRPSKEMDETLGAILDRAYATMVDVVAAGRGLPADQVRTLIDLAVFPAPRALEAKLVDEIATFEAFRDKTVGAVPWTRLKVEDDDGDDAAAGMVKLARFLGAMPVARPSAPHVALVYAVGDVIDGGGDGALGARQEIASRTLVPALRMLAHDDSVKAVVLRIDSGGGSALASELIWHAVAEVKAAKPVVVSMSDVAASGGYYIACGATKIFALDDTLTGSIGVVGGKLAPAAALAKVGVTTFPRGRGRRSTMMASLDPWTADERATVQSMMETIYRVFVERVAAGRGKTYDQIHTIAQGRVWTGADAKRLGLIDELGGLEAALAEARKLGGVGDDVTVEEYPADLTLRDLLHQFGAVSLPFGMDGAVASVARELSPEAAEVVAHTLVQLARFRGAPVQAVTLLPVVFR